MSGEFILLTGNVIEDPKRRSWLVRKDDIRHVSWSEGNTPEGQVRVIFKAELGYEDLYVDGTLKEMDEEMKL